MLEYDPLPHLAAAIKGSATKRSYPLILSLSLALTNPDQYLHFSDLHLSRIAFDGASLSPYLSFVKIRWYALAYIGGLLLAWWTINQELRRSQPPMEKRDVEDLIFYATIGVILGGRLGYALFYDPGYGLISDPRKLLALWDGGMSFHGGAFGVLLAMAFLAWRRGLNFLRVMDYVSCAVPIGMMLGRLANFVNGELWGRVTSVPWAMVFPGGGDEPRHPSQLYEAGLEGLALLVILGLLFWRTDARLRPGLLSGVFIGGMGLARFMLENVREPDAQLGILNTGLTMGQSLSAPMVLVGIGLSIWTLRRGKMVTA